MSQWPGFTFGVTPPCYKHVSESADLTIVSVQLILYAKRERRTVMAHDAFALFSIPQQSQRSEIVIRQHECLNVKDYMEHGSFHCTILVRVCKTFSPISSIWSMLALRSMSAWRSSIIVTTAIQGFAYLEWHKASCYWQTSNHKVHLILRVGVDPDDGGQRPKWLGEWMLLKCHFLSHDWLQDLNLQRLPLTCLRGIHLQRFWLTAAWKVNLELGQQKVRKLALVQISEWYKSSMTAHWRIQRV